MDAEDARYILRSARPNGKDDQDPRFAEALEAAMTDDELNEWLANERAASQALSDKLAEIPVPEELRAKILAGARCSTPAPAPQRHRWLAMAAILVLSVTLAFLWTNRFVESGPRSIAAYRADMSAYLEGFFLLDFQTENIDEIRDWLASKHGFTDYDVPESLASYPSVGCEIIHWHDTKIALICFDAGGELIHLFIAPDGHVPDAPGTPPSGIGEWASTEWNEDGHTYLVLTKGDETFLSQAMLL